MRYLTLFKKSQENYEKILALTPAQLAANGGIQAPAQPPRPTVVLSKIAHAFLESGLTAEAREFLLQAITLAPNGASRARQSLAKLALAGDNPTLAERYAREALLMGRFQAKTIAAWPLYLDARARQNLVPILEPDVFTAFQSHAKARIASAALLCITRTLRAHGDPAWKTIAQSALKLQSRDLVIATEIEKILLADAKLFSQDTPRPTAALALRLISAPACSAKEFISHAKTYARYSLTAGIMPDLDQLTRIATHRFPSDHSLIFAISHTVALGAMLAVKHPFARQILTTLIADAAAATDVPAWGRATWALARMESLLQNHTQAARWYFELAAHPAIPARFRIQATLRGLNSLGKSGDASINTSQLTNNIRVILAETQDFRILLDAARQLALAGTDFSTLKEEVANRGTALAIAAIATAKTHLEQLTHLEYLTRKLCWDLGRNPSVLQHQ